MDVYVLASLLFQVGCLARLVLLMSATYLVSLFTSELIINKQHTTSIKDITSPSRDAVLRHIEYLCFGNMT